MPHFFFLMVRHYKKTESGSRSNCAESQAMVDAYNSVMKKEISARREIPVNAHIGKRCVLSPDEELDLADCLKLLADWGWGFNKAEVKDLFQEHCTHHRKETP